MIVRSSDWNYQSCIFCWIRKIGKQCILPKVIDNANVSNVTMDAWKWGLFSDSLLTKFKRNEACSHCACVISWSRWERWDVVVRFHTCYPTNRTFRFLEQYGSLLLKLRRETGQSRKFECSNSWRTFIRIEVFEILKKIEYTSLPLA